ncbi:aryl-sulfate sulfotransferase [Haladaptatus salinisoli]|uniref:aryl-sulfate sulfotransferase n=1 Tax=Haladaptatus salinisoli TaxID=2884876 RepID=UPI001D0B8A20|nr:aryl-sulfate sulfotransferase [Haladaptatus salinisoli]
MEIIPLDFREKWFDSRLAIRTFLVIIVLLAAVPLAVSYATRSTARQMHAATNHPARSYAGATVVTEQTGNLVVYGENGAVRYVDSEYARYWDVDPTPSGAASVLVGVTEHAADKTCGGEHCLRNVAVRMNLTTGERTRIFSRTYAGKGSNEWHDIDRINATHLVVAGIKRDRVFIANATTDRITWQWNASEHYPPTSGGKPSDWTHINDVEVLPDGRIMVSVRNMDEVVFIEPGRGVRENWTLGEEGNHSILHGQHNPDYIPKQRGGPAVLVADSHNNRVVEYQRRRGEWVQTWAWQDRRMQWTRDADRLPNGNTLIVDTNGDRVLEVNRTGRVVWSVPATKPYDAERLGTGDESAGGPSIAKMDPEAKSVARPATAESGVSLGLAWSVVSSVVPPFLFNSMLFALPTWMEPRQILLVAVVAAGTLALVAAELYWRISARQSG